MPPPRKSLPPRVLDLSAPQYPLPLDPASRTRARAIDRAVVVGGGGGGDPDRSTDPFNDGRSVPTTTTRAGGRLRAIMITYLRERMGTALAGEMVDQYGAVTIARALTRVMRPRYEEVPNSGPSYEEIKAWRAAGAKGQLRRAARYRTVWEPLPGLRRPGGVLRRQLERGAQSSTRADQSLTCPSRSGYASRAAAAM